MKKFILIFTSALTLVGAGCKKGFLDINTNPNQPTTAGPELVLPAALASTGAAFSNPIGGFSFISGWVGYIAISGSYALSSSDFTTYQTTSDFGNGIFQGAYDNIQDYNFVETESHTQNKPFLEGIGKIMKAVDYKTLVDLFGTVPYFEALQATANIHPKYDEGSAIYGDLFKQITAGMALIKGAPGAPPTASVDIMFGRDASTSRQNWLKFGNSLKLKMLLTMAEMPAKPAYYQTELAALVADPNGFLTVDATVNPGYLNTAGKLNPFYGSNYNASGTYINDFWRANDYAVSQYQNNNDPRLGRVYAPAQTTGKFTGNSLGISGAVGSASSTFGPGVASSYNQDAPIMTAAESYFEQAEAALRGIITGNAQTLYEQGVTESFRYLGVPNYSSEANTYYSQTGNINTTWSATTTTDDKLALIIKQKYLALNSINVLEAYNDYRRFLFSNHNPKPLSDLPISQSPSRSGRHIPYLLPPVTSELKTNTENTPTNIDPQTTKPFWMP